MNTTTGSKYQDGMDVTAIAKLIRADIRAAKIDGLVKASVRVSRYSMGQSITVSAELSVPTRTSIEETEAGRVNGVLCPWMTRVAYNVQAELDAIVDAYRTQTSDFQSDYCDTNFYGHVNVTGAQ